ncbi:MAG: homoserine O-succinyltransferase [Liquorilactobacillus ghanensis]|jgi:homoserine O-succinyltransferase|uniref:homoserine O-acetyltransferase/O-succinyltransferase family protein n=1 Tax=Liquorilactobacillus ghanensis TaxID=399370 RepID=UPI0039E9228C
MVQPLQIGILNLMHDKLRTRIELQQVLQQTSQAVKLHFYYPRMHYQNRPVPADVQATASPLDLTAVAKLDAFIITGAPLDQLPFAQITYLSELQSLFQVLTKVPQRLYLCWGAMVALHEIYQIGKQKLPRKLFGVYPQQILTADPLLQGLKNHFWAPHARYAEADRAQIEAHPQLKITAVSQAGNLFLVQNRFGNETMLFSHLEYQADSLMAEYHREIAAHPDRHYQLPEMQTTAAFAWQQTQQLFFQNWLNLVAATVNNNGGLIYG